MEESKPREEKTIAVCGKGGVGKTSLTAALTKLLLGRNIQIMTIDADPAFGLTSNIGFKAEKTLTDIRRDVISEIKDGEETDRSELLARIEYEVFDALEEDSNLAFLAIGRPENEGCYCQVNDFLKKIIESLAKDFDVILIDGEAGIEQINRRVMSTVDNLIIVSDTSAKGIKVASTIKQVAEKRTVNCNRIGLVINKVRKKKEIKQILDSVSLKLLGWIPEDDLVREYDFNNKSFLKLPNDSPLIQGGRRVIESLNL